MEIDQQHTFLAKKRFFGTEIFMFYGKTDFNIEKFWRDKYINKMLKMSQKFPESLKEELV